MANKTNNTKLDENSFRFSKKNYKLLLLGLGVNILGFIFMLGGGSKNPDAFDASALFSFRRITLAPIVIMIGYFIIGYAIMKNPNREKSTKQE